MPVWAFHKVARGREIVRYSATCDWCRRLFPQRETENAAHLDIVNCSCDRSKAASKFDYRPRRSRRSPKRKGRGQHQRRL